MTIIVIVWSFIMWKSFSAVIPPAGTAAIKINQINTGQTTVKLFSMKLIIIAENVLCYSAYLLRLHSSVHSVHLLPDIQTKKLNEC